MTSSALIIRNMAPLSAENMRANITKGINGCENFSIWRGIRFPSNAPLSSWSRPIVGPMACIPLPSQNMTIQISEVDKIDINAEICAYLRKKIFEYGLQLPMHKTNF